MTDAILTLNAGSSSIKFALYPVQQGDTPMIRGKIEGIGRAPAFKASGGDGRNLTVDIPWPDKAATHEDLTVMILDWLGRQGGVTITAAGHRVVHGGRDFGAPARIDDAVLSALGALVPLAPLHQPHNLSAIRAVAAGAPHLPQVACFDTAFHRTMPRRAQLFALPRALSDEGILRYGFHGLSYDYIASVLPDHLGQAANGRVIVAHLGNGASLCALSNRKSVATSMGFTALDGLMMGQRSGALDPGVVLHLIAARGMTAAAVEHMLYNDSGLLGVSGISNAMQVLEASDDPNALEAVALFCDRAAAGITALIPALGGLDALIFTAGIGENSATVRGMICDRLTWLGLRLDAAANAAGGSRISVHGSVPEVRVIPTNEEIVIARATRQLLP